MDAQYQNHHGFTLLKVAVCAGNVHAVKTLVRLGANPSVEDGNGRRTMHLAVASSAVYDSPEAVFELVKLLPVAAMQSVTGLCRCTIGCWTSPSVAPTLKTRTEKRRGGMRTLGQRNRNMAQSWHSVSAGSRCGPCGQAPWLRRAARFAMGT